MIALEVSGAAGASRYGGIPRAIRSLIDALVREDPETMYSLCYRFSRRKRGGLYCPDAPNARVRWIQDPFNRLLLRGDRLLHSMGIYLPRGPRGMPMLATIHDLNAVRNVQWVRPEWHASRSARIRKIARQADHVVTYSRFTANEVCEEYGLDPARVHPVHLGVDTRVFRPAPEDEVRALRDRYGDFVLGVSLVTPRKNLPRLVEAVSRLSGTRLLLVGHRSDGEEDLQRAIDAHGMAERTTRLQDVSDDEVRRLMSAARVYAVPSLYEGFGLTVLEAMACGTPVVCSTAASLPEVAGDAALGFEPTDVDALADALRRTLEDDTLRATLRQRGLERAKTFSWEASARALRGVYREVAGV